ncbi:hypothetical protein V6N11_075719 [Hibiscus sabdariffa]|uniref:Protein FAR1-RELATED SEQUENCE n=1 Tax=Hibiscus sabdariffa TaxID=183260 RepID=A0ABR1Z5U6_9ROSI
MQSKVSIVSIPGYLYSALCIDASDAILAPHLDMEFESHEDAYSYYREYAKYGNKQQSDDAINPRPSQKLVVKQACRHLEYLCLWHDNLMLKLDKCIRRSWTEEQFEKRWWKMVDKFHLREMQWVQALYEDRKQCVPVFMRDVSFAGLSTALRSGSLSSSFDKYVHGETSLREFIERYRVILEDRYEEEAKADFNEWHETPELKSPSPFEKQISLVYTHEVFQKFQVEVLGAAACHLKKENEDQIYIARADLLSTRATFVDMLLLCSTCQVRRYNDLCRRAIILSEEGSLSQESYNLALSALKDALKQCKKTPDPAIKNTAKVYQSVETALERQINVNNATRKGKQVSPAGAANVGSQDGFHQMELSVMRPTTMPMHNVMPPTQLHDMVPTMLSNVASTHFQNVAAAHLHDSRLHR